MPTWTSNIPSQVKTYANTGAFPVTGSVKTIYIAEDTDIAYYWTGSAYQAISVTDVSGLQSKPVVVNSNITAQNDTVYHVVANATFTDPTPVEGRGYVVFLANGTVTLGGQPNTHQSIYYRLYHSGSWLNFRYDNFTRLSNFFVPQTRTINGLDLTANRTLTTANINDSTNRRYVTDAQLTVIGNTSGTNTGDETQSSILSKLGWFSSQINVASALVTTTSPTIVGEILIPANTYPSGGGKFEFNISVVKTSNAGQIILDAYVGANSNNLAGATRIATTGNVTLNSRLTPFRRKMNYDGADLVGFNFSSGNISDDVVNSSTPGSLTFNRTINNYLIFVVTLLNASDNAYLNFAEFKNF